MKKIITSLMALSLMFNASSQDGDLLKNKNGKPILPKAGDYALQMNANPLIDFGLNTVNIMNNTGQTSAHPGFTGSGSNSAATNYVVGKYFLSSSKALRFRLGYTSSTEKEETYGDNPINPSNAFPSNILLSTETEKERDFILGGGMEFRRGYGRLQGYYGGELYLEFGSSKTENEYEIAYNQQAQDSGYIALGSSRTLEDKSGLTFGLGLRGFVGVEYFILPKISIGAEFGLGWSVESSPRGESSIESWRGTGTFDSNGVEVNGSFTDKSEGSSKESERGFETDQGLGAAALNITFHF
tara:strand:- start:347 stop:1243 length:897 start_codon:yes stop_codon:yes gene_type:complete